MLRYAQTLIKNALMARVPPQKPLLVVLGATGTGKSQLAVDLALRFNGEVINGDAMQLYQGLPIVTNKITTEEQQGVPHHLLGIIPLDQEPWRVTMFKKRAEQVIREIRSRGKLPVLVGGTHYYTQSLLFKGSAIDSDSDSTTEDLSREEISKRFPILEGPTEEIVAELKKVDPLMAERWHPKDRRKIQRSLEIFLLTGKKASDVYAEQRKRREEASKVLVDEPGVVSDTSLSSSLLFWVHSDKEILNERLDARIGKMIANGLEDEVLSMDDYLQERAQDGVVVDKSRGIWVSIGWKEFEDYLRALKSGSASVADLEALRALAVEKTQNATRQYARRQIQWIRHKLIPALADENAQGSLYLLDSSDVSRWSDNVAEPAIAILDAFLNGVERPSPIELSENARIQLALKEPVDVQSMVQRECIACSTIVVGDRQWETHLKSRRHRLVLKNQSKKAAQETYLREQKENMTSGFVP